MPKAACDRLTGPQVREAMRGLLVSNGYAKAADEVARCNSIPIGLGVVALRERPDGCRYWTGLNHCKRMPCLICGPYLLAKRMREMQRRAVQVISDDDLQHFSFALSVQHRKETGWAPRVGVLRDMQHALRDRKWFSKVSAGSIRVLESTYGKHGHHPHAHHLVSIRPPVGWHPATFFERVAGACGSVAMRAGMTCDFREGWWSRVDQGELAKTIGYLFKNPPWGRYLAPLGPGGTPRIWARLTPDQVAMAYDAVWRESAGLRWFGASGCWKASTHRETDEFTMGKGDAPDACVGTSPASGRDKVILSIPAAEWRLWPHRELRERQTALLDRKAPPEVLAKMAKEWTDPAGVGRALGGDLACSRSLSLAGRSQTTR